MMRVGGRLILLFPIRSNTTSKPVSNEPEGRQMRVLNPQTTPKDQCSRQ